MPFPLVVIDVTPFDMSPEYQVVMVAACSESSDQGECSIASGTREPTNIRVSVVWSADLLQAKILVGLNETDNKGRQSSSELRFRPQDSPLERWRSVGFAIPTLVGEWKTKSESGAIPPPSNKPENKHVPPATPTAEVLPSRFFYLGGFVGPGLDRGPLRLGALGHFSQSIGSIPLALVISARYAARPAADPDLSTRWADLGLGFGTFAMIGPEVLISGDLEGVLGYFHVRAKNSSLVEASGARLSTGIRARLTATWPVRSPFAMVFGGEAWSLSEKATIHVGGESVGAAPALGYDFLFGARLRLP